jgi:hypothetical protein
MTPFEKLALRLLVANAAYTLALSIPGEPQSEWEKTAIQVFENLMDDVKEAIK